MNNNPNRIGPYEIIETIAEGGQAVVYRAKDPETGEDVAVKVLTNREDEARSRFAREIRLIRDLDHPNLIRVLDAGEEPGISWFAMEYVPSSLGDMLNDQAQLPIADAVRIASQASEALAYANAKGVTHRDIKPSNILLTSDGTVKLVDFGIARIREGTHLTHQFVGSPPYASPEQFSLKGIDARRDIYSLGIVLFEMVCGARPFIGPNQEQWADQHQNLAVRGGRGASTPSPATTRSFGGCMGFSAHGRPSGYHGVGAPFGRC